MNRFELWDKVARNSQLSVSSAFPVSSALWARCTAGSALVDMATAAAGTPLY